MKLIDQRKLSLEHTLEQYYPSLYGKPNGKITIKTSNPIWRNELTFQKENLLNKLKKREPELNIKEIEFR